MPLKCNCFKRPDSPEEAAIKLGNVTEQGRRFTLSSDFSQDPFIESELTPPFMHDFNSTTASFDPITPHSAQFMIRRRSSLQAINHAARKLRDKLSHDSNSSSVLSPRASRKQIRSDVTDSQSVVLDKDAVVIKTPGSSLPRSDRYDYGGSIQISPQQLRKILDRSRTPSPQPDRLAQSDAPEEKPLIAELPKDGQTKALSRMLTDRASRDVSQELEASDMTPHELRGRQRKYTFPDTPNRLDHTTPARASVNDQAADLKSRKVSALSACVPGTDRSVNSPIEELNEHTARDEISPIDQISAPADCDSDPLNTQNTDQRPSWTRGALGMFKNSRRPSFRSNSTDHDAPGVGLDLGGVDGSSGSRTRSHSDGSNARSIHLYNLQISRRLASSNQHLLSSASSPELRAVSSSSLSWKTGAELLPFPPHRRPSSTEFSALEAPVGFLIPKRADGSSQYSVYSARTNLFSDEQLVSQAVSRRASKSPLILDTSAVNSLQQSRNQSSEALASKYPHSHQGQHLRRALTVAKTRNKSDGVVGSGQAEGLLRSRSLASDRIDKDSDTLRRANTASTTRYFSHTDIDDLYSEISKRTPPSSRVVSRYDGQNDTLPLRPSLLNPDRSARASSFNTSRPSTDSRRTLSVNMSPKRKPSLVMGLTPLGSSIWDKALQEHVKEDARIMRQNPGSFSAEFERRRSSKRHRTSDSLLPLSLFGNNEDSGIEPVPVYRSPLRQLPTYNRPPSSSSSTSSWSRYPSHTRKDRIDSPATEADNVYSRDFAPETPSKKVSISRSLPTIKITSPAKQKSTPTKRFQRKIKKAHSARIIQIKSSWKDLKRTKLLEVAGKLAIDDARGHRSSISDGTAGAGTKMPELEMLSPLPMSPLHESFEGGYFPSLEDLSKPFVPITQNIPVSQVNAVETQVIVKKGKKDKKSKRHKVKDRVKELESKVKKQTSPTKDNVSTTPKNEVNSWSQLYDSCVKLPFSPSFSTIASPSKALPTAYAETAALDHFSPLDFDSPSSSTIDQWNWSRTPPSGQRPLFSPPAKGMASTGGVKVVNVFGSGAAPRLVESNIDAIVVGSPAALKKGVNEVKVPEVGTLGEDFDLLGAPVKEVKLQIPPMKKDFNLQAPPTMELNLQAPPSIRELSLQALPQALPPPKNLDLDSPGAIISESKVDTGPPTFKQGFVLGKGAPGESGGGLMERRKTKAKATAAQVGQVKGRIKDLTSGSGNALLGQAGAAVERGERVIARKISEVDPLEGGNRAANVVMREEVQMHWGNMVEGGNDKDVAKGRRETVDVDPMDILGRGSIGKSRGRASGAETEMLR